MFRPKFGWLLVFLVIILIATGCSSGSPPASSTTSPGTATTAIATPSSPAGSGTQQTVGQLASAGQTVFANRCAKCHGAQGQGVTAPAIIGSQSHLNNYGTAQRLLDFISTTMPLDAPGSLSQPEYLQLLSFLLVQNGYLTSTAPLDSSTLNQINLSK